MEWFELCRERRAAFVAVVLVTLGTGSFVSPARADDEVPGSLAAAETILVAAVVAEPIGSAEATESTEAAAATASELEASPALPAAPPDTTADSADISADIGTGVDGGEPASDAAKGETAPAASAPSPAAPAVQASPANVNVSVRVDSPGDAGPVTQLNVAVGGSTSGSAPAGKASPPDASAAAGPVAPRGDASDKSPAQSTLESPPVSPGKNTEPTWRWNWDCGSQPSVGPVSSSLSQTASIPTNWTWNWNSPLNIADEESGVVQYRVAIAVQYHPVNVNVSIRVAGPGNDGPVTQTNVAVTVSSRGGAPAGSPGGGGASVDAPPHVPDADDEEDHRAMPPVLEITFRWDTAFEDIVLTDPAALAPEAEAEGELVLRRGLLPFSALTELTPEGDRVVLPGLVTLPTLPAVQALTRGRAGGVSPLGRPGPGPDSSTPTKTRPRWTAPRHPPLPVDSVPAGASAAASSGGGSSSGGLPIFLALPFLAAMLDLARRVALSRATWPSGHRARVPETPG